MSMIGLAASPGTAVEPMCSSCSTLQPRASRIRPARPSNCRGQAGSGSVTSMPVPGPVPATTQGSAPWGGAESSNDTISARLGISAVYGRTRQIRVPAAALWAAPAPDLRSGAAGGMAGTTLAALCATAELLAEIPEVAAPAGLAPEEGDRVAPALWLGDG